MAAGIGGVIAQRASLSGAAHGCQTEIGAASATTAGGLVYLLGGNASDIDSASALALKNLLGLACDSVAGTVSRIPADEVFGAMDSIGKNMSEDFRETAKGGLAATSTGEHIKKTIIID